MRIPMITDRIEQLARCAYGNRIWFATAESAIGKLPSSGFLAYYTNGMKENEEFNSHLYRSVEHGFCSTKRDYDGHIFTKAFRDLTKPNEREQEKLIASFLYVAPVFGNPESTVAMALAICPHIDDPNIEITLRGYLLQAGKKNEGFLGNYGLSIGLEYGGKDREFQPENIPELKTMREQVAALWKGQHPAIKQEQTSIERFPLLSKSYGAEISLDVGIERKKGREHTDLDAYFIETPGLRLRINDSRLEGIANEIFRGIILNRR